MLAWLNRVFLFLSRRYGGTGFRPRRRRIYRRSRRPTYRRSNYKRRLVGGAVRAARTNYTGVGMCRDLGTIWPNCLIVKLRSHWRVGVMPNGPAMTDATDQGYWYDGGWACYPAFGTTCGPLVQTTYSGIAMGGSATVTGFTPVSAQALGIDKLLAEAKASPSAPYSRCCVLSVAVKQTHSYNHTFGSIAAATQSRPIVPDSEHVLHMMNNQDVPINSPTTQANMDSAWNQPDVKRKKLLSKAMTVSLNTDTPVNNMVVLPTVNHVWKYKVWPHKLLDKTFTDYVSEDTSFGTDTAFPSRLCGVQYVGFFPKNGVDSNNYLPPTRGVVTVNAIWTCLFKNIAGNQV